MSNFKIEKLCVSKNYKGFKEFDCNDSMINRFVQKNLKKRVKKSFSQAFVLLDKDKFIGFYTLENFSIVKDDLSNLNLKSLPPSVPVVKLGMLAISKEYQKRGLGAKLLKNALLKVVNISNLSDCVGIYLLSQPNAKEFYLNLGFSILKEQTPTPMFLHIDTIKEALS